MIYYILYTSGLLVINFKKLMFVLTPPRALEDFDSNILKIKKIPKRASLTCAGSVLIRKVVEPIPYLGKTRIRRSTLIHFGFLKDKNPCVTQMDD